LEDSVDQLKEALSDNIDADYAEIVINLNAQSNAYTAALQAAGSIIQQSLLDFIS
jgi:flagellin-like hook-associated protein FlgL